MEDLDKYFEKAEYDVRINESDLTKVKETNEIYSYTNSDEEVKSIHIISSYSSKNFEDKMANTDFEFHLT